MSVGNMECPSSKITRIQVSWATNGSKQPRASIKRFTYSRGLCPFKVPKKPYDVTTRNARFFEDASKPSASSSKIECNEAPKYPLPQTKVVPEKPKTFSVKEVKFISEVGDLLDLVKVLNAEKEIAVDVEHNDKNSFLGMTCLIQISTRSKDYIVDTLSLWKHIHLLNGPFRNPAILKVFHAAKFDMMWLNRDFGLEVENLFDTQEAMRCLWAQFKGLSLKKLIETLCGVTIDKEHQLSDWSQRPLSKEMLEYAANDTHSLLFCFDELRNRLIDAGSLDRALKQSEAVASIRYQPPSNCGYGFLKRVRVTCARKVDEGEEHVLPGSFLAAILKVKEENHGRKIDIVGYSVVNDGTEDKEVKRFLQKTARIPEEFWHYASWESWDRAHYEFHYYYSVDDVFIARPDHVMCSGNMERMEPQEDELLWNRDIKKKGIRKRTFRNDQWCDTRKTKEDRRCVEQMKNVLDFPSIACVGV
uniref:3'-5' exonuclease domain-containing protein n=1 Tax=Steinernema glaseri TaxID=37863 RepID=A0A1I7YP41_9BILA